MFFSTEFEFFQDGDFIVCVPFGMDGGTQATTKAEAMQMSLDWLKTTIEDSLIRDCEPPQGSFGNSPVHGGEVVGIGVCVSLDAIPSISSADAGRMLGVSRARVAQLCKAGLLESWVSGTQRRISLASVEARLSDQPQAGRPTAKQTH